MFVKLSKSGPRRYLQLAESYRDENGRVKQRTIASLGRVEKIDAHFDSVIRGLRRATGGEPAAANGSAIAPDDQVNINFEPTRTLGDVWTLTQIWKELGFDRIASVFRSSKRKLDVEAMIRVMVFNRLCDPESKLGVLRWLDTVCMQISIPVVLPTNIYSDPWTKRDEVDKDTRWGTSGVHASCSGSSL
jgi:hypothetical protein